MTNPYRPPTNIPSSRKVNSRQTVWACIGFAILSTIAAWSIRDAPAITVTMIAAFGVFLFPFVRPSHRRKVIWCNAAGLVVAIIVPSLIVRLFVDQPNTYASMANYRRIVEAMFPYSLTLSVWGNSFIGLWLSGAGDSEDVSKTD
jgi:hypothetical protein